MQCPISISATILIFFSFLTYGKEKWQTVYWNIFLKPENNQEDSVACILSSSWQCNVINFRAFRFWNQILDMHPF